MSQQNHRYSLRNNTQDESNATDYASLARLGHKLAHIWQQIEEHMGSLLDAPSVKVRAWSLRFAERSLWNTESAKKMLEALRIDQHGCHYNNWDFEQMIEDYLNHCIEARELHLKARGDSWAYHILRVATKCSAFRNDQGTFMEGRYLAHLDYLKTGYANNIFEIAHELGGFFGNRKDSLEEFVHGLMPAIDTRYALRNCVWKNRPMQYYTMWC